MSEDIRVDGNVAQIVSDEELVLNIGSDDGVAKGDRFQILDKTTFDITDPSTNESLGGIKRVLATVEVTRVTDRLAMARLAKRRSGFGEISEMLSGSRRTSQVLSGGWPEGVKRGDPVMKMERASDEKPSSSP